MANSIASSSPSTTPESERSFGPLWFSVLAGPVFYMLFFFAGYLLAEAACSIDFWSAPLLGLPVWMVVEIGLTVVTGAAILLAATPAFRQWRRSPEQNTERNTAGFLAFGALLLAPLFIYITLMTGVFLVVAQPCSWV